MVLTNDLDDVRDELIINTEGLEVSVSDENNITFKLAQGINGKGFTGGSYDSSTGKVFTSSDSLMQTARFKRLKW